MFEKDEIWKSVQVDPDKIICKTCKYKNGGQEYPHYTKGSCEIYPEPQTKPNDVLFNGGYCPYYIKE